MIDEDRVEQIFRRILEAIDPDQGPDGFDSILTALKDAISFQMAFACPICRKRLASKLRQDIPAMLVRADQISAGSGEKVSCNLH
jgi:hypothetical protein